MTRTALLVVLTVSMGFLTRTGAQTINVTGKVVDSVTTRGISGALVQIAGFNDITSTTDANGSFALAK
jgi:hypothetical protein